MTPPHTSAHSGRLAADAIAVALRAGELLLWPLAFLAPPRQPADAQRLEEIRRTLWRLERGIDVLASDPDALAQALEELAELLDALGPQLIAWIDFIEVLVQEAERNYGTQPGRGDFKRQQVKAAILHLLRDARVDIPRVPGYLEPIFLNVAVGWVSHAVVVLLDRHSLWRPDAPPQPSLRVRAAMPVVRRTSSGVQRLGDWLMRLSWRLVLAANPLAPTIKKAAENVAPTFEDSVEALPGLVVWGTRHRDLVAAFVEVVAVAVNEAEGFLEASGPEKKAYARDLVLVLLEENGFAAADSWAGSLVGWGIDVGIEAAVHLFNKHGRFQHRSERQEVGVRADTATAG